MKTTIYILGLLLVAAVGSFSFTSYETAPPADQTKQMLADWERAKAYTLEYLKASNDEVINFKPTAEVRSFGQQMLHIAEANHAFSSAVSGKPSAVAFGALEKSDQYKTKDAVTKAVSESYDVVIATVKAMDDTKLSDKISLFKMDMSKGSALSKAFEHQTHHRGQATLYLRLKGLTPPNEMLF